jgi:hypothetical protein
MVLKAGLFLRRERLIPDFSPVNEGGKEALLHGLISPQ